LSGTFARTCTAPTIARRAVGPDPGTESAGRTGWTISIGEMRRRCALLLAAAGAVLGIPAGPAVALANPATAANPTTADPLCAGSYGGGPARAGRPIRFGLDPGIAGSIGGSQLPSVPDNPARDLAELRRLRPPRRPFVLRLNRLFWSGGQTAIDRFKAMAWRYTRAGFEVELQVRYHPTKAEAGNLAAWRRYVRRVVDTFGPNRRVVAMTITNEVNLPVSPNTSDGSYPKELSENFWIAG
jgi:hypothetical protein